MMNNRFIHLLSTPAQHPCAAFPATAGVCTLDEQHVVREKRDIMKKACSYYYIHNT